MSPTVQAAEPTTTTGTTPLVSVRDVHRHYGHTRALGGVDLTVHTGEVLGIVGHNGAGKSTLMRLISGSEQPDRGDITVHGGPHADPVKRGPPQPPPRPQ